MTYSIASTHMIDYNLTQKKPYKNNFFMNESINEIKKLFDEVKDIFDLQFEIEDVEDKIKAKKAKILELQKEKKIVNKKDEIMNEIRKLEDQITILSIQNKNIDSLEELESIKRCAVTSKEESSKDTHKFIETLQGTKQGAEKGTEKDTEQGAEKGTGPDKTLIARNSLYKEKCVEYLKNLIYEWNVKNERTIILSKETVKFFKNVKEEEFYKEVKKKYFKRMEKFFKNVCSSDFKIEENTKEIYFIISNEGFDNCSNSANDCNRVDNFTRFYKENKEICNFLCEILKINLKNKIYDEITKKGNYKELFIKNNEIMKNTKFYIKDCNFLNDLLLLCLKNNCGNVRNSIEICKDKANYKLSKEFAIVLFIIDNLSIFDSKKVLKECFSSFFDIKKVEKGLFNYFCIFNEICVLEKRFSYKSAECYGQNGSVEFQKSKERVDGRSVKEFQLSTDLNEAMCSKESCLTQRNSADDTIFSADLFKEQYFIAIINICGAKNVDFTLPLDSCKLNINESFFGFKEIMNFFIDEKLTSNFIASYFESLVKHLIDCILSQEDISIQDSDKYTEIITFIFEIYDSYPSLNNYCKLKCINLILLSNLNEIESFYDNRLICLVKDEVVQLLIALFNDTEKRQRLICKISKL